MRKFKSSFKPNREFVERTRFVFLAAFREKFGVPKNASAFGFRYFIRGLALGLAFMAVISGVSVYADQTNVGPESPLYPLKRTHEAVNLLLAGTQGQSELHLKFAERRLDEVKEIKEKNPLNPRILTLVRDLREEVKNSFGTLEDHEDEIAQGTSSSSVTYKKSDEEGSELEAGKKSEKSITLAPRMSQTVIVPVPKMEEDEQEQEEDNKKREDIRKNDETILKAGITSPAQSPIATSSEEKKEKQEIKERSSRAKDVRICASWNGIIQSDEEEVKKIIEEHPEFLEKFERKCM